MLIILYSCSLSPQPPLPVNTNQTGEGNGSIPITKYTISGTLTGSLTTQWKIYAKPFNSSIILGTINYSSSNYTINDVPSSPSVDVVLFKDNNNNNQLDPSEYSIATNISPFNANITNLNFNIPSLNTYTLTFNVSNNIYGFKIGVYVVPENSSSYSYTSPTNSIDFSVNLNLEIPSGVNLMYGIYYDLNNNNIADVIDSKPLEPITYPDFISNVTGSYTTNIILVPHHYSGNITGNTTGFDKIAIMIYNSLGLYSSIFNSLTLYQTNLYSSYSLNFYSISNTNTTAIAILVYDDVDNNGYADELFGSDIIVKSSNNYMILLTNDIPTTNNLDIHIKKVDLTVNLTGVDADSFKITDFKGIILTNYYQSPKTYTVYYDTNYTYNYFTIIFRDENSNNILDLYNLGIGEVGFYDTHSIINLTLDSTSPSTTNFLYTIGKYNVNLTLYNVHSVTNYINPAIYGLASSSFYMKKIDHNISNYSLQLYYITNYGDTVTLGIVADTNTNGADLGDPYIATNNNFILPFISIINSDTNIVFYITN